MRGDSECTQFQSCRNALDVKSVNESDDATKVFPFVRQMVSSGYLQKIVLLVNSKTNTNELWLH